MPQEKTIPGNHDYNEEVKMRRTQIRASPPRNDDTSRERVYGYAQERQDKRGKQSQKKPTLTIIGDPIWSKGYVVKI